MNTLLIDNFKRIVITLDRPLSSTESIDVGSISLTANGRSFMLDANRHNVYGTKVIVELVRDMTELQKLAGNECLFDLLQSDLSSLALRSYVFIEGECDSDIEEWNITDIILDASIGNCSLAIPLSDGGCIVTSKLLDLIRVYDFAIEANCVVSKVDSAEAYLFSDLEQLDHNEVVEIFEKGTLSKPVVYSHFGHVEVQVQSKNATIDTLWQIDIGDITLSHKGRELKLDGFSTKAWLDDKRNIAYFSIGLGTLDEAKGCFEDCKFDLLGSDLIHDDLEITLYVGTDYEGLDVEFIDGSIHMYKYGRHEVLRIDSCDN